MVNGENRPSDIGGLKFNQFGDIFYKTLFQVDFEGGGTYFTRYKCSVVGTNVNDDQQGFEVTQGMGFAFPGRLTHQHAGLPTTAGTRYGKSTIQTK